MSKKSKIAENILDELLYENYEKIVNKDGDILYKIKSTTTCKHKNTYEDLDGGRKEICKDCGKTWG